MSRQIDAAQALAERFARDSLNRQLERARRNDVTEPATSGPRYCARCGDEISPARLTVIPGASCCVECQSFLERRKNG